MQTPEEFIRFEIGSTVEDWLDQGEAIHLVRARDEAIRADERAELERLRAGIEALIVKYDDPEEGLMSPDYYWGLGMASDDLADLLNPPKEGTTL